MLCNVDSIRNTSLIRNYLGDWSEHARSKQIRAPHLRERARQHVQIDHILDFTDFHSRRYRSIVRVLIIFFFRELMFVSTHQLPEPMMHTDAMMHSRLLVARRDENISPNRRTARPTSSRRCWATSEGLRGGQRSVESERRVRCAVHQSKSKLIRIYQAEWENRQKSPSWKKESGGCSTIK